MPFTWVASFCLAIAHLPFRLRRSSPSKNLSSSRHTSAPPVNPRQLRADQPDERVTDVDRHDPLAPRAAHAVDEQRLHVVLQIAPAIVDRQQRLRRPHRRRVVRLHRAAGAEEERDVDRQPQRLPVELDVAHRVDVGRDQLQLLGAVEQQRARPARALDVARRQLEHVPVLGRDRRAAQLAVLQRRLALDRRALGEPHQPACGTGHAISICSRPGLTTSVPSASIRSTSGAARMIASSTALVSVSAEDGQPLHAPSSRRCTTPSSHAEQLDAAAVRDQVRAHLVERAQHALARSAPGAARAAAAGARRGRPRPGSSPPRRSATGPRRTCRAAPARARS